MPGGQVPVGQVPGGQQLGSTMQTEENKVDLNNLAQNIAMEMLQKHLDAQNTSSQQNEHLNTSQENMILNPDFNQLQFTHNSEQHSQTFMPVNQTNGMPPSSAFASHQQPQVNHVHVNHVHGNHEHA